MQKLISQVAKSLFSFTVVRIYLLSQLITRAILCCYALSQREIQILDLIEIFLIGTFNDWVSLCYCLPVILLFTTLLHKLLSRYQRVYLTCCFIVYSGTIMLLIFIMVAEITFWDEFSTRFNFIAVDYLIYTNEIIGTVKESLPYVQILLAIGITTLLISVLSRKYLINKIRNTENSYYLRNAIILLLLSLLAFNFYDPNKLSFSTNRYVKELAKNGPYEFCSAFFNNSLDYNSFYPVIDSKDALAIVRANLSSDEQQFLDNISISRKIRSGTKNQKYNVVFIVVESLSGEFMEKFGNKQNITPNLDKLADESIFFANLYAVGTRTVRGLEALTLSAPPTPGSSIIRRPNNHSLFNIGTVFKREGYDINFIFGGYSYFDNLQNYFSGNGYNILDRNHLEAGEISFANIWGVADEDILIKSLELADQSYKEGKPFFSLIMTTSNHRPYTFPEGRIDLPSGGGRNAAVKYTDYAIAHFLNLAKTHPWFDNTIFVITADHCASSAGKTDLPINKYHIPLLIYAPKLLKPQIIDSLASQIDITPTVLGLLDFSYDSKFFGQDVLQSPPNRAFISTYQLLGFMKNDYLVILSPNSLPKSYKLEGSKRTETNNPPANIVEEAISFYQAAYDLYIQGKMVE
jgi:phosphoglycerol transferase MdoB-like AlkP superfamily enzyme